MIDGYSYVQIALVLIAGLLCLGLGFGGAKPNDFSLGATAVVEVTLLIQIPIAIAAPLLGNEPTGSLGEFWAYLVTAILMPPLAVGWALLDRSRWSTVVLGVVNLAIAVMVWRMLQIWNVQIA